MRSVPLYMIGVDEAKMHIYSYLTMDEVGAGYCHFKDGMNNETYFNQLTAEKRVKKDTKAGVRYEWVNQGGKRNEALDLRVYALAACHNLDPNWHKIARKLEAEVKRLKLRELPKNKETAPPKIEASSKEIEAEKPQATASPPVVRRNSRRRLTYGGR